MTPEKKKWLVFKTLLSLFWEISSKDESFTQSDLMELVRECLSKNLEVKA